MTDFFTGASANGTGLASPIEPPAPPYPASADGLDWLRQLNWRQFEQQIGQAYRAQGYEVLPIPHSNDLILARAGERIVILCQQWRAAEVDVQVVRELPALVAAHRATWGVVISSGEFTAEARKLAKQTRTTLLDGPAVAQLIAIGQVSQPNVGPPLNHPSPVPPPSRPTAPNLQAIATAKTVRQRPGWLKTVVVGLGILALVLTVVGIAAAVAASMGRPAVTNTVAAPAPAAAATVGFGHQPMDIAFDANQGRLYTANAGSGDVTVLNSKSLQPLQTINVAGKPIAVAADPANHRLFVADGAANKIYVVDTATAKTTSTIKTLAKPSDLAFDASRQRLFVASSTGKSLTIFNTATLTRRGQIATEGAPTSVALDSASHTVFVLTELEVTAYNEFSLTRIQSIPASLATNIAVDSSKHRLFISSANSVYVKDFAKGTSQTFSLGGAAGSLCLQPGKFVAYVADPSTDQVQKVTLK